MTIYIQRLQQKITFFKIHLHLPLLLVLLAGIITGWAMWPTRASMPVATPLDLALQRMAQTPTSFMHRPFYGTQTIHSRITSYFDHDQPWYASDQVFVRYDGKRWTGSDISVLNCQPGTNCYDGHNGYDLNLRFEPVLSASAGKVIRAGWYNALNHNDSFGLWVAIDHGNGFLNVYGHLSALTVNVGDKVKDQWQIGTSGTTGSSTGPHLHFGTYYNPSWQATDPFGWTASSTDPNAVPDHHLWTSGTNDTPVPLLSSKGRGIYPGAILVDDGDSGWSTTGNWQSAQASTDIGGKLHWTTTTSGSATASATWQTPLPGDGYYEIGAFVNDNHASSSWATYTIYSADPDKPGAEVKRQVQVDESHIGTFQSSFGQVKTGGQWVGLGTYYFRSTQPARVVLSNATGENGQQISADGVEFATLVPPTYAFAVPGDNTPSHMSAGSTAAVQLTFQNTGNFTWYARDKDGIQVIYRWLDSQQKTVSTGKPVPLPDNTAMNTTKAVSIQVQAPTQPGAYTLQWDLIQGKQSFSQLGAQPHNDSVTIDEASANKPTG